jgi:hypothetical protein
MAAEAGRTVASNEAVFIATLVVVFAVVVLIHSVPWSGE